MSENENKRTVHIFNHAVRGKELKPNDFALILYFRVMSWESGDRYTYEITSEHMRRSTGLTDKSINPSLKRLYDTGYLLEEIKNRKPHKPVRVVLDEGKFNTQKRKDDEYYTKLPIKVFYALGDGKLKPKHVKFLYYIASYINYSTGNLVAYPGIRTRMIDEVGMTEPTIREVRNDLKKLKLIYETKHAVGTELRYDDEGNLIRGRYNNHYEIRYDMLLKL